MAYRASRMLCSFTDLSRMGRVDVTRIKLIVGGGGGRRQFQCTTGDVDPGMMMTAMMLMRA